MKSIITPLTQAELKRFLSYNPDTGVFTWLKPTSRRIKVGDVAGSDDHGNTVIIINKKKYLAHRLAWLYMMGEWPESDIKHNNRIKDDNRFTNLRLGARKR